MYLSSIGAFIVIIKCKVKYIKLRVMKLVLVRVYN